ncbi:MAG TPA: lysylphosphatidylglycerol synthase transmembrane domain-containing protein [Mycobacteriales bacterium]
MTTAPVLPPPARPTLDPRDLPAPARSFWGWARPLGGLAILGFLLWRLGCGPFLAAVRQLDGWSLAAAAGIGAVTTVASAWRWSVITGGLGLRLPLPTAVADCYRSIFLNSTLPGGVLGDVHRAVSHGREVGDVGRGVRAVVWERTAGQVVQTAMALVVLFVLPSPVRSSMPLVALVALVVVLVLALVVRMQPRSGLSRWARAVRIARADVRDALLARRIWPRVLVASVVAVSGHVATFLLAAHVARAGAGATRMIPLALLALVVMTLPLNVGGFGPREGVAAWAFTAAGLTAATGVTTAILYGALVLVASLPGAAVLVVRRLRPPAVDPTLLVPLPRSSGGTLTGPCVA